MDYSVKFKGDSFVFLGELLSLDFFGDLLSIDFLGDLLYLDFLGEFLVDLRVDFQGDLQGVLRPDYYFYLFLSINKGTFGDLDLLKILRKSFYFGLITSFSFI